MRVATSVGDNQPSNVTIYTDAVAAAAAGASDSAVGPLTAGSGGSMEGAGGDGGDRPLPHP